jgi:hypothetical protein
MVGEGKRPQQQGEEGDRFVRNSMQLRKIGENRAKTAVLFGILEWCPRQDLNLLQYFTQKQSDHADNAYFTGCRRLLPDHSNSQLDPLDCSKSVL